MRRTICFNTVLLMAESSKLALGILASHRGTTAAALREAIATGRVSAEIAVVISNNANASVLADARSSGTPAYWIGGSRFADDEVRDTAILALLEQHRVDLILLLGYMRLLGPKTLGHYRGRILNTHPALLPRFGGKGMFGRNVHDAVIRSGDSRTGVTIHLVDDTYDTGPIVAQCEVPVRDGDSTESLEERVRQAEKRFLVDTIGRICSGEIRLPGLQSSSVSIDGTT